MIPLRLKLRNFMPYRGDLPAFSLAGIHTACISGENGAGKSSLIDAITWALWGKARSGADDDLISVGAEETEVEFDFSVAGQIYKSIRKRTRPKKITSSGQTTLDLISFSDGGLNNISGDTLSQTQEIIKRLLHMDYDTFINSAYLRQGHADEFSRQTPARRKEVLASILKLDQYDILADSARNKFRDCQAKRELIEFGIQEIQKDLAVGPQLTEDVEIENKRLAEVNILLTSASQQLES
jgi:exonuclease SbcC